MSTFCTPNIVLPERVQQGAAGTKSCRIKCAICFAAVLSRSMTFRDSLPSNPRRGCTLALRCAAPGRMLAGLSAYPVMRHSRCRAFWRQIAFWLSRALPCSDIKRNMRGQCIVDRASYRSLQRAMACATPFRALRAFAALSLGLAAASVGAFDNSRYDNVSKFTTLSDNRHILNFSV